MFEAELVEVSHDPAPLVVESQSNHKLRILVVEDHAPNRLLLCRQLEYLGHEAFPCDDGEAAFAQWMRAEPAFDLTITDCNMPRMDGYQLSRSMREVEQQKAMRMHPIFGLTANAQAEITEQCLEAGMTRCLFKPVGLETLAPLIAEVAQTSNRRALAAATTGSELDKIKLLSPESYAPLVKEIVLTHREDGNELERLSRENNRDGLVRVAHKIRGGAQLAGDSALTDACRVLEECVGEEDESLPYRPHVEHVLACLQALEVRLLQDLPS
jgi:two-component system sensor histidine kinase EvgS